MYLCVTGFFMFCVLCTYYVYKGISEQKKMNTFYISV